MKFNKNLKGFICMALALVMILGSSFAYFTDRADTSAKGTAGTVGIDLTSDINLLDEDGKDILNPGDLRDSSFGVENTGNKSIDVRTTIVLTSSQPMTTGANGQAQYELYLKDDVHFVEGEGWKPNDGAQPLEVRTMSEDGKTITYNIPDYILNGNEDFGDEGREIEDGITTDSHDYDFVLVFAGSQSGNDFQASTVQLDVLVEAKQHRNTGAGWDIVAQESHTIGNLTQDAVLKADGSEGDIEVEVPSEPEVEYDPADLYGIDGNFTSWDDLVANGTIVVQEIEAEGNIVYSVKAGDTAMAGKLVVSKDITSIASRGFYNCKNLTEVVLPEGLQTIGDLAFRNATGLTTITIPSSVFSIGSVSFSGCTNLKTINFMGTETQWNTDITFGGQWNTNVPADCVINYNYIPQ